MPKVLLIDRDAVHAERVSRMLQYHALDVGTCADPQLAILLLRRTSCEYDVVIINVSDQTVPWVSMLAKLQEACFLSNGYPSPMFLCTSTVSRSPEFQLQIERRGARYVVAR
jgi:ActR/RegA family two-component response regulator